MTENADFNSQAAITKLLIGYGKGDRSALDQMLPLVITSLRRLAAHYLKKSVPTIHYKQQLLFMKPTCGL